MSTQVRKRFLQGFGANVYGQAIVAVIQLVSVPVLLHAWGTELYGEWLILFSIPAYLSMSDLGFSEAAANDMSARVVRGDQAGAVSIFKSLLVLVFVVAALGAVSVSVVLWFLPIGDWLHLTALGDVAARWVLWLLALEMLVRLVVGSSRAGFRAGGDYGLHITMSFTTLLIQYVGIWFVALIGYGPVAAAIVYLVIRILSGLAITGVLLGRHPWLRNGLLRTRRTSLRPLLKPALANVSLPLAQGVNIQGMVVLVGVMLGPPAVVVFVTLRTLSRLVLQGANTVSNALEPELAFAWGAQNKALLRKLFICGLAYSFWLAVAAAVVLYLLGPWILGIWTHHKVAMNFSLFAWLLLSAVIGAFWYGNLVPRKAANLHLRAVYWYVTASLVAVVLAVIFLRLTGRLSDAGLALLLMDVLVTAYVLATTKRFLGISPQYVLAQTFDVYSLLLPIFRRVVRIF